MSGAHDDDNNVHPSGVYAFVVSKQDVFSVVSALHSDRIDVRTSGRESVYSSRTLAVQTKQTDVEFIGKKQIGR